jgi:hypothetical protein
MLIAGRFLAVQPDCRRAAPGVSPTDPLVFGAVALLVAIAARDMGPGIGAAAVDPAVAKAE